MTKTGRRKLMTAILANLAIEPLSLGELCERHGELGLNAIDSAVVRLIKDGKVRGSYASGSLRYTLATQEDADLQASYEAEGDLQDFVNPERGSWCGPEGF